MAATADGPVPDETVSIVLEGRITAYTAAPVWKSAAATVEVNPDRPIVVDASRLEYIDDVGIALLFDLVRRDRPPQAKVQIHALAPNLAALLDDYDPKAFVEPPRMRQHVGIFEHLGRATAHQ